MTFAIQREILDNAVAGDAEALGRVLKTITPHVERQLLRYPFSHEDRRDLLQVTLMKSAGNLGSFRAEASFLSWLFRVTANEALMLLRSHRRHRARFIEGLEWEDLATPSVTDDPVETISSRERDEMVNAALSELSEDYRDLVIAHYHMGLGLQEIAEHRSITESAVRSRLHRARS
jgi:RNA polymerase sigma-70 factor (ECF subfamily)